ncbi:MAG: (d)CMP kinase [Alphaproteobacteria bacterium]|nr:(d)CMP kinase [Alphaproteobacteria bacterium]
MAIDGPASSGKGTVARLVAQALGFTYVDTGAMYRCVALLGQRRGLSWDDGGALAELIGALDFSLRWERGALKVEVDGEDLSQAIRTEAIGQGASAVARLPEVRAALLDRQRALAAEDGVVMDGRDIGTVVLPDAELKIFLDAALGERARRRQQELEGRGVARALAEVQQELAARDAQDSQRATAPLRQADDALRLDSTTRSPEEVAREVVDIARRRGA